MYLREALKLLTLEIQELLKLMIDRKQRDMELQRAAQRIMVEMRERTSVLRLEQSTGVLFISKI